MQGGEETAVDDWLELANGCLCCTMKSELVAGLEGLLAQRHRFDYILIETSGASRFEDLINFRTFCQFVFGSS